MSPNYLYKARLVGVVDGDTMDLAIDLGFKITHFMRVRLARIDTAEMKDSDPDKRALAQKAKEFVQVWCGDGNLIIKTTKDDKYGRYLAEIYRQINVGWRNLSDDLLEAQLAKLYS